MAYNTKNRQKTVNYIMAKYEEWKVKNYDIPDTYFVRVVLRDLGHFMSYNGFMINFKSAYYRGKPKPSKSYWQNKRLLEK